jgi:predicted MFS family arabinose efflux permease
LALLAVASGATVANLYYFQPLLSVIARALAVSDGTAGLLGVQGAHISNQAAIYGLHAEARSRLTTAYIVSMFLGGIVGSTLSTTLYAADGWTAICALGAGLAIIALTLAATSRLDAPSA